MGSKSWKGDRRRKSLWRALRVTFDRTFLFIQLCWGLIKIPYWIPFSLTSTRHFASLMLLHKKKTSHHVMNRRYHWGHGNGIAKTEGRRSIMCGTRRDSLSSLPSFYFSSSSTPSMKLSSWKYTKKLWWGFIPQVSVFLHLQNGSSDKNILLHSLHQRDNREQMKKEDDLSRETSFLLIFSTLLPFLRAKDTHINKT